MVDHRVRTNVGHVFAAGDVNARSMLVHVARLEGRAAADNAVLESDQHVSWSATPSGSFTDPEFAKLAKDDVPNLTAVEQALRGLGPKPALTGAEFSDLVTRIKQENALMTWDDARSLAMGFYDGSQTKLWEYARRYTLADHFFHAAFGGSLLNHFWMICACTPRYESAPDAISFVTARWPP